MVYSRSWQLDFHYCILEEATNWRTENEFKLVPSNLEPLVVLLFSYLTVIIGFSSAFQRPNKFLLTSINEVLHGGSFFSRNENRRSLEKSEKKNLQIYWPKKANSEKLGLGIDNPCRIFFIEFANEQVLGEGWWPEFLDSWSFHQLRDDTKMSPQLKSFFFHRHIYSLWLPPIGLPSENKRSNGNELAKRHRRCRYR